MDIDSVTPEDMRFNPPGFAVDEIASLVGDEYRLSGEWSPLPGERDQNFRLRCEAGEGYVVKIAGRDEDPDITDFQVQALLHLESSNPSIPLPRLMRTAAGNSLSRIADRWNDAHGARGDLAGRNTLRRWCFSGCSPPSGNWSIHG